MLSVAGREVGPSGFGLMSLTHPMGPQIPKAQAFAALNAALENGANFWNGGQFYGTPEHNSLHLLHDYFKEFPENADKVVLSIKGGITSARTPDGSASFVRKSVDDCLKTLPPSIKKIDIFECARVDPNVAIEDTMQTMKELVEEGKFSRVGLSEVKAETIRRANAVVPIAVVEVEFSLFETSILENGVASICAELEIPIIAYSPLGGGILTGQMTSPGDIPASSPLRWLHRFQDENVEHNFRLVQELRALSEEFHPYSMTNIALSWVRSQSQRDGLPIILPISGSSKVVNIQENSVHVPLTKDDLERIDKIRQQNSVIGARGYPGMSKYLEG